MESDVVTNLGLQTRYDQEVQRGRIAETERAALADQVDRKVNRRAGATPPHTAHRTPHTQKNRDRTDGD